MLFVCTNLARHAKVDVGSALRRANLKFERRFRAMRRWPSGGVDFATLSLQAQDGYWERVKAAERDDPAIDRRWAGGTSMVPRREAGRCSATPAFASSIRSTSTNTATARRDGCTSSAAAVCCC